MKIIDNGGVFLGKLGPIQDGHEKVAKKMFDMFGEENSLIILGSCNSSISLRHFFTYPERRGFIKTIFPEARIIGLPDYPNDTDWLIALDDLLIASGINPVTATYFSGCEEDVVFFYEVKRRCHIVNRFDGSSTKVSSTEIRDCLIHDRSLKGFINPLIEDDLKAIFKRKWEEFKKI